MLDVKLLREDCEAVAKRLLEVRGFQLDVTAFNTLEEKRKAIQTETQSLQHERNAQSKEIGKAKSKGEDITSLLEHVATLGEKLDAAKATLNGVLEEMDALMLSIPNIPHETVPLGKTEADNQEVRRWGDIPSFSFQPRSHDELGESLGQMDFATAAKITGSRFVVMRGVMARLHRALSQFMLDIHTGEHDYQEVYVPFIVNKDSLVGSGQLPKFEDDLFKINSDQHYYLTSTGEVPVVNTVRDTIFSSDQLPIKLVSHTPCFRQEAGSYGKDTKGMIRQHQFEKVELIWVTTPEKSYEAHEALTEHAEAILRLLKLPYRVVSLCGGDLGFTASKTYDLEVWLPSQDTYREISSCSNCETFQARRMKTRFKENKETIPVHTLNGSGLAVGRTLVAICENYQTEEGHIVIPEVLKPYMGGMESIKVLP
jgi:seryl-tRNA synthetase